MRTHPLAPLILTLLAGCSAVSQPANPVSADGLTLMTYNTEFLWDGVEPEDGSSRVEFEWRGDSEAAAEHMAAVAEAIRRQNPDILVLQEVEDEAALNRLNDLLEGLGYTAHFVQGKDTFTGQDEAMLSRLEPENVGRVEGEDESASR